MLTVWYWHCM